MLLSRSLILLILSFSLNTVIGSEILENQVPTYLQGKQPLMIAAKPYTRRRGDCGTPPDVWLINFCEQGPFCYVDQEQVSFWLKDKRSSARLKIKNVETGQSVSKAWPSSQPTLPWPVNKMQIQSGIPYLITLEKRRVLISQEIILHQIPANLSVDEQVAKMKEKGCEIQAKQLENPEKQEG